MTTLGVRAPKVRVCSLCGSAAPRAGCPQCELTQPSLFSLPMPPLTEEDVAAGDADRAAKAGLEIERVRRAERLQFYGALDRPVRVGLVGCAKTKRSIASAARQFYASDLFRSALAYAERATDEVYILSAFHELVAPDQILAPYDHALSDLKKSQRLPWGDRVVDKIAAALPQLRLELVVLAGAGYVIPVQVHALGRGWTVQTPLAGLSVGERLQWLKREADALAPAQPKKRGRSTRSRS